MEALLETVDYLAEEGPDGDTAADGGDGSFEDDEHYSSEEHWTFPPWFVRNKCEWGMAVYEEGEVMWSGCTKKTCGPWGWEYEEMTCCEYLDSDGKTAHAFPGDTYYNGCNTAICSEDGEEMELTRRGCNDKCVYKNWDVVRGYAEVGVVQVYDENAFEHGLYGCPKFCDCEATDDGHRINCLTGSSSCIMH